MPLVFQNKMPVWVKDLPVMWKIEEADKEVTEYDCEGALICVLREYDWVRLFVVDTEMESMCWKPEHS
jgi:hypothetical protein